MLCKAAPVDYDWTIPPTTANNSIGPVRRSFIEGSGSGGRRYCEICNARKRKRMRRKGNEVWTLSLVPFWFLLLFNWRDNSPWSITSASDILISTWKKTSLLNDELLIRRCHASYFQAKNTRQLIRKHALISLNLLSGLGEADRVFTTISHLCKWSTNIQQRVKTRRLHTLKW